MCHHVTKEMLIRPHGKNGVLVLNAILATWDECCAGKEMWALAQDVIYWLEMTEYILYMVDI